MSELYGFRKSQGLGPRCGVDVAADGVDRSDGLEPIEDGRVANVPGVDDRLRASQGRKGFGPQQPVGVGDEANDEAGHGGSLA